MQPARIIVPRDLVVAASRFTSRTLPRQSTLPVIIPYQQLRQPSSIHEDSKPASSHKTRTNTRESWFTRRRRERSSRKRISTLALDRTSSFEGDSSSGQGEPQPYDDSSEAQTRGRMTRRQRRLLVWTVVLSMPVWGREILETVVPGMIGVFIFVAGRIKSGIIWTRSLFPDDGR